MPARPRIMRIALSTYAEALECSADRAVVTIDGHRARCHYGHRWVKLDEGEWRSVGRD